MNEVIFCLLGWVLGVVSVDGQELAMDSVVVADVGTVEEFVPECWEVGLDSLMKAWHVQYYLDMEAHPGYGEVQKVGGEVYAERLSRLGGVVELPYNEVVGRCIDLYVERRRSIVEVMLGMERFYFPMFEQALDAQGLPVELKYLPVVESALNPKAFSREGASGLWQFMMGTGQQYGLEVSSLVDERCDPVRSTEAACAYLKDLFGLYGDWALVLAAYNCGPGTVNKAIRRAGGKTDYWKIYPFLPRETRLYVPLFVAASYVMNYYAYHGLRPVPALLPMATDTVMVGRVVHFDQITEVLGVERELLRALNPQYRRDIVPGNLRPMAIRLPALAACAFVEKEGVIAEHRGEELLTGRASEKVQEKIVHRVVKGETIRAVGSRYGVSVANIRKWNKLTGNRLAVGRRLVIYVNNGGYALGAATPTVGSGKEKVEGAGEKTGEFGQYRVRSGDSFYSISKRFPGYSSSDLMRMNNLTSAKLKVGQYIKVPKV
jgi:membrane-bound lytic murein transglycosylase D